VLKPVVFALLLVILISLIINNFAELSLRALFPHDNPLKRVETRRDDDEKRRSFISVRRRLVDGKITF